MEREEFTDSSPALTPEIRPRELGNPNTTFRESSVDVYASYPYNGGGEAPEEEAEEDDEDAVALRFQRLIHPGDLFGEELVAAMQDGVHAMGGTKASKTREYTAKALTAVCYASFEAEEYKWINNSAREEIDFDSKLRFLESASIFSKWSLDKISALAWLMKTVAVPKGRGLCQEGETSDSFCMIYSGQVDIHVYDKPPPPDPDAAAVSDGSWGWGGANDTSSRRDDKAGEVAEEDPNAHRTRENLRVTKLERGAYLGETGLLAFFQRTSEDAALPKEASTLVAASSKVLLLRLDQKDYSVVDNETHQVRSSGARCQVKRAMKRGSNPERDLAAVSS